MGAHFHNSSNQDFPSTVETTLILTPDRRTAIRTVDLLPLNPRRTWWNDSVTLRGVGKAGLVEFQRGRLKHQPFRDNLANIPVVKIGHQVVVVLPIVDLDCVFR